MLELSALQKEGAEAVAQQACIIVLIRITPCTSTALPESLQINIVSCAYRSDPITEVDGGHGDHGHGGGRRFEPKQPMSDR
jgi:hypothetical protein